MKRAFPLLILSLIFSACKPGGDNPETPFPEAPSGKPVPNVILLIGDGMGLSQLSSAYYYKEGSEPHFSRFKHIGLMNTSSGSHKITDSAAGATAFSAGVKTYNGAIGVDMDSLSVPSILEELAQEGYATGLVSSSSITHATPASFFAHAKSRNLAEDIALQLVDAKVDYFAGGGRKYFVNREDQQNLLPRLEEAGYTVDTTGLALGKPDPNKRYGYLLAEDGMAQKNLGRDDILPRATQNAIDYLDAKKSPFFLMVEGSQIDWGGHANDSEYLIAEVLDFDEVVGLTLDYAEKQGNTLVIVTADHETGGFTLSSTPVLNKDTRKTYNDYNEITPTFSTGGHSTTLIPVFAKGPGSEKFQGVYQNTFIYDAMILATLSVKP